MMSLTVIEKWQGAGREPKLVLPEELKKLGLILSENPLMPCPVIGAKWRTYFVLPDQAPLGEKAANFLGTKGKILIGSQTQRNSPLYYCACLLQGQEIVKIYFWKERIQYFFFKSGESGGWQEFRGRRRGARRIW